MKYLNQLTIWMIACCFYSYNPAISLFIFMLFFISTILNKLKRSEFFFVILFGIAYFCFISYLYWNNSFEFLSNFINKIFKTNIRNNLSNYFIKIHKNHIGSFFSLILLNIKNEFNKKLYYNLISLSIVHLIVISGYHVNLFCIFFKKIFCNISFFKYLLPIIIAFVISYLNGFSSSRVRVLASNIFLSFSYTRLNSSNLSTILICLVAPKSITSLGVCMSLLGSRGIKVFFKLEGSGHFYENIFSSFFATLYILPFVSYMNEYVSLWAIFYSLLFTPIFMIVYFLSLFFCWFNNLDSLINFFYLLIANSSKILSYINVEIPIKFMSKNYFLITFYSILELVNLFLIKERKKEKWKLKNFLKK